MFALRVNESKLSSRNAFIVDHFPLGGKYNQNMMKEPSFGAPRGSVCLNP